MTVQVLKLLTTGWCAGEKLKLVTVLIHQLLTTAEARNWLDDCAKKLVTAQRNLKCHQMAEQRRSRDETQFWLVYVGNLLAFCFDSTSNNNVLCKHSQNLKLVSVFYAFICFWWPVHFSASFNVRSFAFC